MAIDKTVAVGSAKFLPAISGAEPCTGSNIDGKAPVGLIFPLAANPIPPQIAARGDKKRSTSDIGDALVAGVL